MAGLEKAKLIKLSNDRNDRELEEIPVQFNPASLKLTLSNNTEGGQSTGRMQRQYTGNASTELAFDLVFDTADEDDGSGAPRNVREKTAKVEQFVLAQGSGGQRQSPPRVMFEWGGLRIKGVISQVALDFDLFAENGFPLRAKMSLSIKEQDARFELLQAGPGSSTEGGAPPPGAPAAGAPGTSGGGAADPAADRAAEALDGESAADFAARNGLLPAVWRGLASALDDPLSLQAGVEIGFSASLSASAGIGVSVGFQADVGVSLEASLGLEASASVSAGASASASAQAGFALSAAGGVGAAVETTRIAKAEAAAGASIRSFASGATASAALATGGASPAASGAVAGFLPPAAAESASASPAPPAVSTSSVPNAYAPPRADPRALSFGFGVPLRRRVTGAAAGTGVVALRPYATAREAPVTRDPTTPPWEQLPKAPAKQPPSTTSRPSPSSPARDARPGPAPAAHPVTTRTAPRRSGGGGGCGCGGGGRGR